MAEEVGGYVCIIVNTCITCNKDKQCYECDVYLTYRISFIIVSHYFCGVQVGAHPPKVL